MDEYLKQLAARVVDPTAAGGAGGRVFGGSSGVAPFNNPAPWTSLR